MSEESCLLKGAETAMRLYVSVFIRRFHFTDEAPGSFEGMKYTTYVECGILTIDELRDDALIVWFHSTKI